MQVKIVKRIVQICMLGLVFFPFAAWGLENGDFESGETGWYKNMKCPGNQSVYPGVSVQSNSTLFPAVDNTSTKTAVYYGRVGYDCKETDAYLKQTITIPSDATSLKFYYKVSQPPLSLGLTSTSFKVKLMEAETSNPVAELFTLTNSTVVDWKQPDQEINVSSYAGQTYDFYFQFSVTGTTNYQEAFFLLDNISFVTGPSDPVPGNINGDTENKVDLADAILSLQILAGVDTGTATIVKENDADANGVIGLENPIYILQKVAGLRTEG